MDRLYGKRIFIVEDDAMNMAVFAVTLKRNGAVVIQDPWNDDTIHQIIDSLPIHVIVLDLMLRRKVSGYDIFDQIRAQPELANIPVVVVSASDPEIEIPRAQSKGIAGFIGKPINVHLFPEQIAALIEGEHVWYTQ
jgi:CheY-like chemotaxis protein